MRAVCFLLMLIFASANVACFSQEPVEIEIPSIEELIKGTEAVDRTKSLCDKYEEAIKKAEENVANVDNVKTYENWLAFDLQTQQKIKITDLPKPELQGFLIFKAESLEIELARLADNWAEGFKELKQWHDKLDPKAPIAPDVLAHNTTMLDRVPKYQEQLRSTRIELAYRRLELIQTMLKDNKDDADLVKELTAYLEKVKASNKKNDIVPPKNFVVKLRQPAEHKE